VSWKDSVNVPKHETVRLIVKFDDYPGKWMFTATSWITRITG
jgi:hypothetical protein